MVAKEQSIKLRLDDTDRARLDRLAEHYSLTISAVIRMLAKRECDAIGAAPKPSKRKKQ